MNKSDSSTIVVDVGGTFVRIGHQKRHISSDRNSLKKTLASFINRQKIKPKRILLGMRGVWTADEKKHWKKELAPLAKSIIILSDIELAHYIHFQDKPGVVLNAGTGSIAWGRNEKGKTARAGGLGPLMGDEGSAFWMGREYLKNRYQRPAEFLPLRKIAIRPDAIQKIAAYSAKALGNPVGKNKLIIEAAHRHLLQLVRDLNTELQIKKPLPVKLVGGLFQNKRFKTLFEKKLKPYNPVA